MNDNKIYCGNGKEHFFSGGGSVVNLMLDLGTLERYFTEYGFTSTAGNKKIKLKVYKNQQPDNYGNTHNLQIDTWRPEGQNNIGQGFHDDKIGNAPF